MKDLIIIGSGPAGLSAAVYARRAMLDLVVLEKEVYSGGQIVNTERVDNYLGLMGMSGYEIGMKFREHAEALGVPFADGEVVGVEKLQTGVRVILADGSELTSRAVLIATGAKHRELGVPGEREFAGAGVSYCAVCDGAFFRNKEVAVVGGGDVALEDALYLSKLCSRVHIIHRRGEFRGARILGDQVLSTENIEFHPSERVMRIDGEPGRLVLTLEKTVQGGESGRKTDSSGARTDGSGAQTDDSGAQTECSGMQTADAANELCVSGLFIAVGTLPVTDYLQNLGILDEYGYVKAGENCMTSVPGIFAAGDVRTKQVRQVATAVGDGAAAVYAIEEYLGNNR